VEAGWNLDRLWRPRFEVWLKLVHSRLTAYVFSCFLLCVLCLLFLQKLAMLAQPGLHFPEFRLLWEITWESSLFEWFH
jgi:hypothetical protein